MPRPERTHPPVRLTAVRRPGERVTWSRVMRPGAGGADLRLLPDPELRTFLVARLREEVDGARRRRLGPLREPGMHERGLRLLHELLDDLRRGELPDETSLQVLLTAHSGHPDFRTRWS